MPGYIKLFLIFILGLAVAAPLPGAVVSAAPDNGNQSVESYFKNKDKKDTEEKDQTNNVPANEEAENETNDVGITFGDIFRMVFALLFVAGLLYVQEDDGKQYRERNCAYKLVFSQKVSGNLIMYVHVFSGFSQGKCR